MAKSDIEYDGVPNLDQMSEKELGDFWGLYRGSSRTKAAKLIGDRRQNYVKIAQTLANYAINRSCVMSCERDGNENGVRVYGHACQLSFNRLPKDLRWR